VQKAFQWGKMFVFIIFLIRILPGHNKLWVNAKTIWGHCPRCYKPGYVCHKLVYQLSPQQKNGNASPVFRKIHLYGLCKVACVLTHKKYLANFFTNAGTLLLETLNVVWR